MLANRYIFLLLLITPFACHSQSNVKQRLEEAMKKTKRTVVLPSGDTISTTNKRTHILNKEDLEFFRRDTINIDALNILYSGNSKYRSLEDAANNISELIDTIKDEQDKKDRNQSLSFKLSQKNRNQWRKEREAEDEWEKRKSEESIKLSVHDMVNIYEKYGDKPTYYVNGVNVDESVVNQLREADILSRQFKISNTASNNPNGEIWVEVPIAVAQNVLPDNASSTRGFIDTKHRYESVQADINKQKKASIKPDSSPDNNSITLANKTRNISSQKETEFNKSIPKSNNSIISRRKAINRPNPNNSAEQKTKSNENNIRNPMGHSQNKEVVNKLSNKPVTLQLKRK